VNKFQPAKSIHRGNYCKESRKKTQGSRSVGESRITRSPPPVHYFPEWVANIVSACLFLCAILKRVTLNLNRVLPISRARASHVDLACGQQQLGASGRGPFSHSVQNVVFQKQQRQPLERPCGGGVGQCFFLLLPPLALPPSEGLRWRVRGGGARCRRQKLRRSSNHLVLSFLGSLWVFCQKLSRIVTFFRRTPGFVVWGDYSCVLRALWPLLDQFALCNSRVLVMSIKTYYYIFHLSHF
jgi:hypothetical protein